VAELDVVGERVAETAEVGGRPRLLPGLLAERLGPAHLGGEVGRDADGLLVVAADPADRPGVDRVRVLPRGPRLEHIEQPADLRVRAALVHDLGERRELVPARAGAPGRHHRVLVPEQQAEDRVQVGDLGHPLAQEAELARRGRAHVPARL
jgi:hypothetical protein